MAASRLQGYDVSLGAQEFQPLSSTRKLGTRVWLRLHELPGFGVCALALAWFGGPLTAHEEWFRP